MSIVNECLLVKYLWHPEYKHTKKRVFRTKSAGGRFHDSGYEEGYEKVYEEEFEEEFKEEFEEEL